MMDAYRPVPYLVLVLYTPAWYPASYERPVLVVLYLLTTVFLFSLDLTVPVVRDRS